MKKLLTNPWVLRIELVLIVVCILVLGFSFIANAQTVNTHDVVMAEAPDGISGGVFTITVGEGRSGVMFDINCNGRLDLDDVVQFFQALINGTFLMDCHVSGPVARITDVTFPDYGLTQVMSLSDTTAQVAFTDLNLLVEPGTTDIVLFTVEYETITPGRAPIVVVSDLLDDDNGDQVPSLLIISEVQAN